MYVTFSDGPSPSIVCSEAIQWLLKVPMNVTKWGSRGVSIPNFGLQLHIRLKFEVSVVFGLLKAMVDELPKEIIEFTTGTWRS